MILGRLWEVPGVDLGTKLGPAFVQKLIKSMPGTDFSIVWCKGLFFSGRRVRQSCILEMVDMSKVL